VILGLLVGRHRVAVLQVIPVHPRCERRLSIANDNAGRVNYLASVSFHCLEGLPQKLRSEYRPFIEEPPWACSDS
jgi:hypothetical protein